MLGRCEFASGTSWGWPTAGRGSARARRRRCAARAAALRRGRRVVKSAPLLARTRQGAAPHTRLRGLDAVEQVRVGLEHLPVQERAGEAERGPAARRELAVRGACVEVVGVDAPRRAPQRQRGHLRQRVEERRLLLRVLAGPGPREASWPRLVEVARREAGVVLLLAVGAGALAWVVGRGLVTAPRALALVSAFAWQTWRARAPASTRRCSRRSTTRCPRWRRCSSPRSTARVFLLRRRPQPRLPRARGPGRARAHPDGLLPPPAAARAGRQPARPRRGPGGDRPRAARAARARAGSGALRPGSRGGAAAVAAQRRRRARAEPRPAAGPRPRAARARPDRPARRRDPRVRLRHLAARLARVPGDARREPRAGARAPYRKGFDPGARSGSSSRAAARTTRCRHLHARGVPAARPSRRAEERYDVETNASAYLVVRASYARGWQARVDGVPTPVMRANGKHRAVAVAAGAHEVVLRYEPPGLRAGSSRAGLVARRALRAVRDGRVAEPAMSDAPRGAPRSSARAAAAPLAPAAAGASCGACGAPLPDAGRRSSTCARAGVGAAGLRPALLPDARRGRARALLVRDAARGGARRAAPRRARPRARARSSTSAAAAAGCSRSWARAACRSPGPATCTRRASRSCGGASRRRCVLVDEGRFPPLGPGQRSLSLFDVLEHIDDDVGTLAHLREVLEPGGVAGADRARAPVPVRRDGRDRAPPPALHARRSSAQKLRAAGFEVLRLTHFMAPLVPLVSLRWAARALPGAAAATKRRRRSSAWCRASTA